GSVLGTLVAGFEHDDAVVRLDRAVIVVERGARLGHTELVEEAPDACPQVLLVRGRGKLAAAQQVLADLDRDTVAGVARRAQRVGGVLRLPEVVEQRDHRLRHDGLLCASPVSFDGARRVEFAPPAKPLHAACRWCELNPSAHGETFMRRVFAVLLAGGLLMGSAHAADRAGDAPPSLSREDAERLRATEQACRELIDSAALLGERLQEVGVEMQRLMAETGAQLGREMAPAM